MKKDIAQVRKDIARRKQKKRTNHVDPPSSSAKFLVEEEEKHGYFPTTSKASELEYQPAISKIVFKTMVAGIIFLACTISYQLDQPWLQKPKHLVTVAFTEEFPFATVNQWYQSKFGSPLAFVSNNGTSVTEKQSVLPVNGTISESFQTNGQGILIATDDTSKVFAMDEGTVLFAGNDRTTNKTVIIQHPDKSKSIYGNLSDITVNQYQFIKANQEIGSFAPSENDATQLYFAIEKNNQYLDPVQVIKVDETS